MRIFRRVSSIHSRHRDTTQFPLRRRVSRANSDRAKIDERKLIDYVLSPEHSVGRFKAAFFRRHGLTVDNWEALRDQLLTLARNEDAEEGERSRFGQKYLVSGILTGKSGQEVEVQSVWIILHGDDIPQLVTVYPR